MRDDYFILMRTIDAGEKIIAYFDDLRHRENSFKLLKIEIKNFYQVVEYLIFGHACQENRHQMLVYSH